MVRLSFSVLPVASLAIISASPYFSQCSLSKIDAPLDNLAEDCIDFGGKVFKENEPFRLLNLRRDVLAENYALFPNVLFMGQRGDPAFTPLDLCVVTGPNQDCSATAQFGCIRRDFKYRFLYNRKIYWARLYGEVWFSSVYESATDFSFSSHDDEAVRIVSDLEDGKVGVFRGMPGELISVAPSAGGTDELFFIEQPDCMEFGLDTFQENHPFRLVNSLNDALAENYDLYPNVLFLGKHDDPTFTPLDICVVTGPDQDCSTAVNSGCIRRDVKYRFQFHLPSRKYYWSYLYGEVWFSSVYESATDFSFSSHDDEAVRIVSDLEDGKVGVFRGVPGQLISVAPSAGGTDELFLMESNPIQ
ncbi:hypothetical protein BG000_001136 [Podila horticola]|nr:hypothetical protein BG000_001136 [Podila horticola]